MRYAIGLAVLLSACSTHYVKPGGSPESFERDYYECQKESAALQNAVVRERMEDRCLRLKGWRPT